jgi:hypothetical protein
MHLEDFGRLWPESPGSVHVDHYSGKEDEIRVQLVYDLHSGS